MTGTPAAAAFSAATPRPSAIAGCTNRSKQPIKVVQIVPKAGESHYIRKSEFLGLPDAAQFVELALTEDHQPSRWIPFPDGKHSLEQVAMTLAFDQLPGRRDRDTVVTELKRLLRTGPQSAELCERLRVDGAANDGNLLIVDFKLAQHLRNCLGDRNDFAKRLVPQCRYQANLCIVDPARHNRRDVGQSRGNAAQYVSAATAVAVHDVRLLLADELGKTVGERQVQIAGAEQVVNPDSCGACGAVDAGTRRAHQQAVVTATRATR